MSRTCCFFHAMNNGPVDQPCRWAYPVQVSVWHNLDGRIAHTLDHRALVQDHNNHVEPATTTGTRCPCGWRNVGILLVEPPRDDTGGLRMANYGDLYHASAWPIAASETERMRARTPATCSGSGRR